MAAETRTLCPYCGVGCGLVTRVEKGRLQSVAGDPSYPVNRGRTCRKPLELRAAVHARDRATAPLIRDRRDVRFRKSTWGETMPVLSARLRRVVQEHGPDAVAFYVSGQLLSEDYYAFAKLVKGFLGTNNLDSNSRLCMSSAVAGYQGAFGFDGPPPAYADLGLADCFLLVGSNAAACHPIVWGRVRDRQAEGASVICLDPRPTATARAADLHLPLRPGTDLALLNALLHVVERDGLVDHAYVERSTSRFEEALAVVREWPPERAAEVCGVEAASIEHAARRFARASRSMVLWSMGVNQSVEGTATNRALLNLCLATGQLGRPGAGPLSLTGQPNAMGGREAGGLAQLLPGYRSVESASDRRAMERHWGCPPLSARPGLPAVELFDALADGHVRAVWIVATNPLVSLPDSARARAALERAELVVVQDAHHPTETSALAHAVLPAAAWPEKQGVMTNSERRVALVRRALDPPGQALPDWRIAARLAVALGYAKQFAWRDEAEVYAELAACTAGRPCDISGLTHERLLVEGSVQWPCPDEPGATGRERLYTDGRFPTPDGRARFAATPYRGPAEHTGVGYPLTLTTGRLADQWHTMTRTGKSPALREGAEEPFVELHPADAREAGVAEDASARVVSRRGSMVARVRLEPRLPPGVAYVPFHFGALHAPPGAGQANAITLAAVDPVSHQPELKATAVRIEPLPPRRAASGHGRRTGTCTRRLVVVGTGRAALETVERALAHAPDGSLSVTMLGEEAGPVYDRIRLSQVLAGAVGEGDLELRPANWYRPAGVTLLDGTPAAGVEVERGVVWDAAGAEHTYDALVIATGSRPFVPPVPGAELQHVRTFRTLADVAGIVAACRAARPAVVVGGGLLGLEAAAGLIAHGVPTTVVEASDRLMPQQLDAGGATLLERSLARLGVGAVTGARLTAIEPDAVALEHGERLAADLVVVAAGIRPEATLARAAGIETDRGILVDDAMRTSAPRVWAVGECAQHRDTIYGLWTPIAEQARVAAASVCGAPAGFHGWVGAATLKVAGVDVFAGGTQTAGEGQVEVVWSDGRRGVYRKLVLEDDRLAGAVLVGDASGARELSSLLREGGTVPERLLGPPGGADEHPGPGALVCSCNSVSRSEIETAVRRGGLTTVAQVGRATRAGTGCGSCTRDIERVLAAAGPEQPERAPALHRAETLA